MVRVKNQRHFFTDGTGPVFAEEFETDNTKHFKNVTDEIIKTFTFGDHDWPNSLVVRGVRRRLRKLLMVGEPVGNASWMRRWSSNGEAK